jgi:hypothetical protein
MRFARVRRAASMLAAACFLSSASPARSQSRPRTVSTAAHSVPQDSVRLRLQALGARGSAIEQAREHVIAILSTENSCSAWFREADPDVAATFESLDFTLHDGPKYVVAFKSAWGGMLLMHPYSAAVQENAGHNATVLLNANGPFFENAADILERNPPGRFARIVGRLALRVGSFDGNTLPAQITTLFHELGHVIGLLPDDSDELSGLSRQNTQRVLHACRAEIKVSAREHRDTTRAY